MLKKSIFVAMLFCHFTVVAQNKKNPVHYFEGVIMEYFDTYYLFRLNKKHDNNLVKLFFRDSGYIINRFNPLLFQNPSRLEGVIYTKKSNDFEDSVIILKYKFVRLDKKRVKFFDISNQVNDFGFDYKGSSIRLKYFNQSYVVIE